MDHRFQLLCNMLIKFVETLHCQILVALFGYLSPKTARCDELIIHLFKYYLPIIKASF